MHPILVHIPSAFGLEPYQLVLEIAAGVACLLGWLALSRKKKLPGLAGVLNFGAFLVGLHLLLSYVMKGEVTIYTFGVIVVLAFFAAAYFMTYQGKKIGLPEKPVFDFAFWMLVIGIIGARLFYAMINWDQFSANKGEIFKIWNGGLVWYGGVIPAVLIGLWIVRRYKLPLMRMADLTSVALMLSLGVGRWACFSAGDDYGKPAPHLPWSVTFNDPNALVAKPLHGVPLHPSEMYMSVNALWLFFFLEWMRRKSRHAGVAFGWSLILYAATRALLIEPIRGDFVERTPAYAANFVVPVTVSKGAHSPAVHVPKGTEVNAEGRAGKLMSTLDLPAGRTPPTTVYVYAMEPLPSRETPPPSWRVTAADIDHLAQVPGIEVVSGQTRHYDSDLPKPPDYVSTSQWLSILVAAAGFLVLWITRKVKAPGLGGTPGDSAGAAAAPAGA